MMIAELAADPVSLIEQGAPHLIHSDEQLDRYTRALFALTAKDDPTEAELETIELLSLLIQRYEAERFPVPTEASPLDVLRFLMDQHHLIQRDLIPDIGSESLVSQILNGKRGLTPTHMRALAQRFHVPASVFLGDNDVR